MAARRPVTWLQPDEEVLLDGDRHPLSILDNVFGITLLAAALVAAVWIVSNYVPLIAPFAWPVTIMVAVLWGLGLLAAYWRVRTSRYIVTSDRIYRAHGRIRFFLVQTTYDKMTDLHVHQSLFGRIWDFGTVTAQTAGTGLAMQGVRAPLEVKRRIETARRRFIDALLQEHGLRRAAAIATASPVADATAGPTATPATAWQPVDAADELPLWRGGPVGYTLVPAILSGGTMFLFGLVLAGIGTASEEMFPGSIFGILLVVGGVLTVLQAWVQYRFTRYEVGPSGVVVTSGWLSRRRVEATFDKVTDVTTYQNFLARLFDFGNIRINTAGSNQAPINFNGLPRPEHIKSIIDDARRRHAAERRRP